jgi:hypothetical protein
VTVSGRRQLEEEPAGRLDRQEVKGCLLHARAIGVVDHQHRPVGQERPGISRCLMASRATRALKGASRITLRPAIAGSSSTAFSPARFYLFLLSLAVQLLGSTSGWWRPMKFPAPRVVPGINLDLSEKHSYSQEHAVQAAA